ncbi:MAG: alpha-L-fucosidase [Cyclobacteriaceae bacterium]
MIINRLFLLLILGYCSPTLFAQTIWSNPIVKQGRIGSPLVEISPFVFNDHLYLLENNQRFWDVAGAKPGDYFHEDEVRIRDLETNRIVSVALKNHGFGTVVTWGGRVYVFAGDYGGNKPWRNMTEINMTSSADLKTWTKPVTVLKANGKEFFYNTAVCRGKDKFILLYETNDRTWKPFTFRYMESDDLKTWKEIPGAIYGKDKYVGGPALYHEGDHYYTLYLEALKGGYETRVTRSKDLIHWEDAPGDRPFITFDPTHRNLPLLKPDIHESNASDVELCYYKGKTILYFTGSDQSTAGDLQWATYNGTPRQLLEYFFGYAKEQSARPPVHQGDWAPVFIQAVKEGGVETVSDPQGTDIPSPEMLEFQERQLGAFIHFGLATYANSEMLIVPDAALFSPSKLNADQWVKAAKSFGAKHVVLTVKHHNGFCLWPTRTTTYSVKNSPWKNGKGDVVREFVDACRKNGVKVGFYVSGGDKSFGCTSTPDPMGKRKIVGDRNAYFPVYLEQLRELLTNYGEVSYLWFDGAYDPFGWDVRNPETLKEAGTSYGDAIDALVEDLQPQALIFGGTKPDVRWSGSEQGWAAYPIWNVVKPEEWATNYISPQRKGWMAVEANIHTRNSWFWKPGSDNTLRSIDFLTKVYLESIGRGANQLINMTPDTSGLIPAAEVKMLDEFGKKINSLYASPLVSATFTKPTDSVTLKLPKKGKVGLIEIEENLKNGQHINSYTVEVLTGKQWKEIASGSSIGRKRLHIIDPVEGAAVRLKVQGDEGTPEIRKFAIYQKQ